MFHNVFYILVFGWTFMVFGYLTTRLLIASLQISRWQRGEAILERLVIHPRVKISMSMDAPIEATYAYDHQGVRYHGTRISVFDSIPDMNFGYGALVFSRLRELYVNKQAIRIRLDPRNPGQSVLIDMPVGGPLWLGGVLTLMSAGFLVYFYFEGATPMSTAIGLGSALALFLLSMVSRSVFIFIAMAFASL